MYEVVVQMKKVLLSLVLIVVLMLTACGYSPVEDRERDLYSLFDTAASAEELIEFSNIEIQQRLIDLGFLEGSADSIIGPKTIEAITRFQEMVGLEPTGKFDDTTLITLFSDEINYVPRTEIALGDHDYLG